MRVQVEDEARTAFVDPATGATLGTTKAGGVMKTVRDLHSLAITGTLGNALIEIAAGWAIVLIATGLVLWWPRGTAPALGLRGPASRRRFWRDLHAATGVLAGGIILFLAVTGMPWSVFWGKQAQNLIAESGLGRPKAPGPQPWEQNHAHGAAASRKEALPWTLQAAEEPRANGSADIGVDPALLVARTAGLAEPMTISLPQAAGQPYSISHIAGQAEQARSIFIEPSSGRVLQDARFEQFGTGAQVIEWGIATHQGEQYGAANRWLMLAGCVSLLLLCASAPVMWWKRRKQDRLTAPPLPKNPAAGRQATIVAVVLGFIYPLTGATMLLVLGLDRLLRRRQASTR